MANYEIKEKQCPHCGKTFDCFSRPGCRCEYPDHEKRGESCPCPDCVRTFANLQK